ncbi:non-ribosomal peptide synthetase [Chromobacterium piscinae]|uniref:Non-ribosomal peptide synthetase n=5 Tax=Chromobacterium piscinae TaxID=686831 RepID=A0ABV0H6Z3_9NEIS
MNASFASSPLPDAERLSAPATHIGELLVRAAASQPEHGLRLVADDRKTAKEIRYPELLSLALRILAGLQARGLEPGIPIALLLEQAEDFIPAFWACALGAYVPCPLAPIRNDPERWEKHLTHVDQLLGHPALIIKAPANLRTHGLDTLEFDQLLRSRALGEVQAPAPDAPAVLVLTSGSTGNAKAVILSHANLLSSLAAKTESLRLAPEDIGFNWISFDHVAALIEAVLLPTHVGMIQAHAAAERILSHPLSFLHLLSAQRATLTFTPNFLFGEINRALVQARPPPPALDLSRLRRIISGGEAVVVETASRFLSLLAPHGLAATAISPAFGMTETCAGSVFSHDFPAADAGFELAALGRPVRGMQLRIVDEADQPLPDGQPGELQLRGPMVFRGYYRNPDATRAAFSRDGWFRSGDIGQLADGELRLVGRSKDSIIVSGVNYFSQELELAISQLDGVDKLFIAAFPTRPPAADTEQLVLAFFPSFPIENGLRLHQTMIAIRNTTLLLWGFRPSLVLPLPKEAFPKTSLGKIQRALLRRRLEEGALDAHIRHANEIATRYFGKLQPAESEAEQAVAGIFADMFSLPCDAIGANSSFFDLGGTSLDILKLKHMLERRFDCAPLPVLDILTHPIVRRLAARLEAGRETGGAAYDPIVTLQSSGAKTPLFCVHPGVGEVLVFVSLAQYFVNERPFHALRARGFNEGESHFTDFNEMVAAYVAAIRGRQARGPYAIAGYSYGGAVAFEIAKALEADGERVDFIGIFNLPPHIRHRMSEFDPVKGAVHLAFFLSLIDRRQADELPDKLRALPDQDFRRWLIDHAPPERLAELDLDLEKFTAWSLLAHSLTSMGSSYEPSGSVRSLSVFYAHPLYGNKADWLNDELRRWDDFSREPNHYIEVDGEHNTMLDTRHVAGFQAALRQELDCVLNDQ